MTSRPDTSITNVILDNLDGCRVQLAERVTGLTDGEYRWEPVPDAWNVREGDDGGWNVDLVKPEPEPAPITTIAWRLWHIGLDCFDSYSGRAFGSRGTSLSGTRWVGTADEASRLVDAAIVNFADGVRQLGDEGVWREIGSEFGPWQHHSVVDLALHAQHELAHHTGEVGLLRDLHAARGAEGL